MKPHPLTSKLIILDVDMPFAAFEDICKKMDRTPASKSVTGSPDNILLGHIVTYQYKGTILLIGTINTDRDSYIVQVREGLLIEKTT